MAQRNLETPKILPLRFQNSGMVVKILTNALKKIPGISIGMHCACDIEPLGY